MLLKKCIPALHLYKHDYATFGTDHIQYECNLFNIMSLYIIFFISVNILI